jgi:hypothetical protein
MSNSIRPACDVQARLTPATAQRLWRPSVAFFGLLTPILRFVFVARPQPMALWATGDLVADTCPNSWDCSVPGFLCVVG